MTQSTTTQYQFATATTTSPDAVLEGIAGLDLPGDLSVTERGSTYLVIGPRPSKYDARLAVALSTLVALAVLIITAFAVVLIALLPLAVLPLVPLLLRDKPLLAVGAVPDDGGATRVTVHGQAPANLTASLDHFLSGLPLPAAPAPPDPGQNGGPRQNGHNGTRVVVGEPVRAPERTAAD
jgi:hypothetical protein